jgi:putative tricarboxylic transport membrane protein
MKQRVPTDALVWIILGIGMCIGSVKLKLGDFHTPGPGFLPFLSGALLGIFGLILTFSVAFEKPEEEAGAPYEGIRAKWDWKKLLNPLLTLLSLFAYLVLLEPLGFLLTTFICLFFLFKLSERKKWLMPLTLSISTSILSYLLFSVWLQCQFPKGVIKF